MKMPEAVPVSEAVLFPCSATVPASLLLPLLQLCPPRSLSASPLPPHPCCPPPLHPPAQASTLKAILGQVPWRDVVGSLLTQLWRPTWGRLPGATWSGPCSRSSGGQPRAGTLARRGRVLARAALEANLGQGPWCDVVGSLLAQLMDASPPSPPRRSGVVAEQGGDNGADPRDRVGAWPPRPRGGGGGPGADSWRRKSSSCSWRRPSSSSCSR